MILYHISKDWHIIDNVIGNWPQSSYTNHNEYYEYIIVLCRHAYWFDKKNHLSTDVTQFSCFIQSRGASSNPNKNVDLLYAVE